MARVGINPARGKVSDYRPKRVTVAVLTYIPDLSGYFEQRLEVLKLVFASLRLHTTPPYDLIVFDNGSCQAAVDFLRQLRDAGQVQDAKQMLISNSISSCMAHVVSTTYSPAALPREACPWVLTGRRRSNALPPITRSIGPTTMSACPISSEPF